VPEAVVRTTTTIELKKTTRNALRLMMVHAEVHCYDDLINEFIMPILEEKTGARSPSRIGEVFATMKSKKKSGSRASKGEPPWRKASKADDEQAPSHESESKSEVEPEQKK